LHISTLILHKAELAHLHAYSAQGGACAFSVRILAEGVFLPIFWSAFLKYDTKMINLIVLTVLVLPIIFLFYHLFLVSLTKNQEKT